MAQDDVPTGSTERSTAARSGPALSRTGLALALIALVAVALAGIYRRGMNVSESRAQAEPPRGESVVRDGSRMTVPEGSPLRSKLVIAAVTEKDVQRKLELPAVVEADPARTAK